MALSSVKIGNIEPELRSYPILLEKYNEDTLGPSCKEIIPTQKSRPLRLVSGGPPMVGRIEAAIFRLWRRDPLPGSISIVASPDYEEICNMVIQRLHILAHQDRIKAHVETLRPDEYPPGCKLGAHAELIDACTLAYINVLNITLNGFHTSREYPYQSGFDLELTRLLQEL